MKSDSFKYVAGVAALLCAATMYAKETSWSSSRANDWDWTNPANFTNGKPEDGDTVVIPEKMVVYATNETAQTLLNKLSCINMRGTRTSASNKGTCSTLVIDVPAGQYELACALNVADASEASGSVRKTGSGTLVLTQRNSTKEYYTDFEVEAGVLDLRNLKNDTYNIGALGIAEGATVVGPDKNIYLSGLYGNGLLTAEATSDRYYRAIDGIASNPYVFSGKITGGINFRTRGAQYMTGAENSNSSLDVFSYSASKSGKRAQHLS